MGLQIEFNSKFGASFTDAYARVRGGRFGKIVLNYAVDVYVNRAAYDAKAAAVDEFYFQMGIDNSATTAEIYGNLKTQPGFEAGVDV